MLGGALCKELSKYYNIYCTGKSSYKSFVLTKNLIFFNKYDELINYQPNIIILSGSNNRWYHCIIILKQI